ncbi:hypothetical protein ACFU7X_18360 [Streptomyces chartreusis]|uniref:hypothetical protein n=1 Tax=Streptomyces chartreusis TaxID=1969 RepID=UPI00367B45E6
MVYLKLTADTVGSAREIIGQATGEIDGALRERPAGVDEAIRPLRMTIHLVVHDLEVEGPVVAGQYAEAGYTTLQANTVLEARAILDLALSRIAAEMAARPARRRHRDVGQDRPLRASIHFDLNDLDRDGSPHVSECLHLPYDGVPPGLQPRHARPGYRWYDERPGPRVRIDPPQRRSLLRRLLGGG